MIIREEVDIHGLDDFFIAWQVLLPIAVSFSIGRTAAEVVSIWGKTEVRRYVRPAGSALAQVHDHGRLNVRLPRDVKHDRNLIGRECTFANDDDLAFGDLVIVPDCKVKAPEAFT